MINHHDGASLTHSMNCGAERCFAAEVTDSALMIGRVCADKAEGRLRCHRAAIAITRQGQRDRGTEGRAGRGRTHYADGHEIPFSPTPRRHSPFTDQTSEYGTVISEEFDTVVILVIFNI